MDINRQPPEKEPERQFYFMELASKLREEFEAKKGGRATCHVTTFGCQMNARDSEKLAGILERIGFVEDPEEESADFVIFNTCTVRDNADQRLYGRLGHLKGEKYRNPNRIIALCGCLMQEESAVEKIKRSYPYVNIIFGTHNIYKLAELICIQGLRPGKQVIDILKGTDEVVEDIPSVRKYPFKSGVNIMYGCNNFCSYCIVPYVRGRERSRRPKEIIREIERLAADGVVEVMLLGQNVNSYGKGLEEEVSFAGLLREAERVEGIERIRFMTPHPKDLSDELIEVMSNSKKICRHIHLPLQSGSSRILEKMNRHYTKEGYIELALKIRERIPDIAITTDIITGFPSETQEDVDDTLDVIERVGFDGAFTFIYSPRKGTPAAKIEDNVSYETKSKRFMELVKHLEKHIEAHSKTMVGKTYGVLVDGVSKTDKDMYSGYTEENKLVHFKGDESMIGKIVKVKINESHTYSMMGEIVNG